jgi:hypothetical protein
MFSSFFCYYGCKYKAFFSINKQIGEKERIIMNGSCRRDGELGELRVKK